MCCCLCFAFIIAIVIAVRKLYGLITNPTSKQFFHGQTVIITGASKGIGAGLAVEIAKCGASHLVLAARSSPGLQDTKEKCLLVNPNVKLHLFPGTDVSDEEHCENVIQQTLKSCGIIHTIILNAAMTMPITPLEDISPDPVEFCRSMMETNYMQVVYFFKHALPALRNSGGTLVGISSVAGLIGAWGQAPYSASKHAMQGLCKSLQVELKESAPNVRVVLLPVPFVRTEGAIDNTGAIAGYGLSVEEAAKKLAAAVARRPLQEIITFAERFGVLIGFHFPSLMQWISRFVMKSKFEKAR